MREVANQRQVPGGWAYVDNAILLEKVKTELSKRITIARVYLFGSRARGVFHIDSDYDFAVISSDFSRLSFMERQQLVRPLIRKVIGDEALDVACYTPEEFERGKIGFLPGIIEEEGIVA